MDLIKIEVKENEQLVSARELHEKLGATERFSSWFNRMLQYGFVENEDFTGVKSFTVVNNGAKKEIQEYILKLDMAKQICMLAKNEKGQEFRRYFIEVEKSWNDPSQVMARALKVAQATIDNYQVEILQLQDNIKENKPKVILADSISDSDDLILVRELAKIITQNGTEIGEKRLFSWLRENEFLIKRNGSDYNLPTQRSVEMGLFRIVERTVTNKDFVKINKTPKVTTKGQKYFINKFLNKELV